MPALKGGAILVYDMLIDDDRRRAQTGTVELPLALVTAVRALRRSSPDSQGSEQEVNAQGDN